MPNARSERLGDVLGTADLLEMARLQGGIRAGQLRLTQRRRGACRKDGPGARMHAAGGKRSTGRRQVDLGERTDFRARRGAWLRYPIGTAQGRLAARLHPHREQRLTRTRSNPRNGKATALVGSWSVCKYHRLASGVSFSTANRLVGPWLAGWQQRRLATAGDVAHIRHDQVGCRKHAFVRMLVVLAGTPTCALSGSLRR